MMFGRCGACAAVACEVRSAGSALHEGGASQAATVSAANRFIGRPSVGDTTDGQLRGRPLEDHGTALARPCEAGPKAAADGPARWAGGPAAASRARASRGGSAGV